LSLFKKSLLHWMEPKGEGVVIQGKAPMYIFV